MDMNELENMSPEELLKLQSMVAEAQERQQWGSKYQIHKTIDKLVSTCRLPNSYYALMGDLVDMEPSTIIPSILDNDKILRFPTLMVLSCFFPCSEIDIRCGLVELFDSYVYHSDFGVAISNLIPFDVDRTLRSCRSHNPQVAQSAIEEFYRKVLSVLNSPSLDGGPKEWIKKCMDDLVFITHVISGVNLENRFSMSLMFMLPDISVYDLNDPSSHNELINRLQEDGSDLLYARRIAHSFKL